jgi:hypothetical protein
MAELPSKNKNKVQNQENRANQSKTPKLEAKQNKTKQNKTKQEVEMN